MDYHDYKSSLDNFKMSKYKIVEKLKDSDSVGSVPMIIQFYDKINKKVKLRRKALLKFIPIDTTPDNSHVEEAILNFIQQDIPNCIHIPKLYHAIQQDMFSDSEHSHVLKDLEVHDMFDNNSIQRNINLLFCELASESDLDDITKTRKLTILEWKVIIFQVLYTLAVLQKKYQFVHNDLHTANVLVQSIKKQGTFKYKLGDKKWNIPNTGMLVKLWDFEFSNTFTNPINNPLSTEHDECSIEYISVTDSHFFLHQLYYTMDIPNEIYDFISSVYPEELLISFINIYNPETLVYSDLPPTKYLTKGKINFRALKDFKLPTVTDLLGNKFFDEFRNENEAEYLDVFEN